MLITLLSAAAVSAAPAVAGGVTPPVIHEPFTALPCPLHPDTTIDVIGCQEHRLLRTDRAIDAQVKAIFQLLRTESARSVFVGGERSWLRYRRQSCATQALQFAGGTAHGVALLSCEISRNKAHLADLTAMRKALARR